MTKKDYELFANEIHRTKDTTTTEERTAMIHLCIAVFSKDNSDFNPTKFGVACYEGKHIRKSIKGESK